MAGWTRGSGALLSAALLALTLALSHNSVLAQTCPSVPLKTLSTTCPSTQCDPGQICVSGATECRCISATADKTLKFLIGFDSATAAKLKAYSAPYEESIAGEDNTDVYAWASSDEVTAIGQWTLPLNTMVVWIRGGNSLAGITKGFVASVNISAKFLDSQTQVSQLYLSNLNLGSSVSSLVKGLPSNLQYLQLSNGLITEFPAAVTRLRLLKRVTLSYNDITEVTSSHNMDDLLQLDLGANKISSFTGTFPSLTYLNLAYNRLTGVPAVIAKHTNLKQLHLGGNTILNFSQIHAVESVEELTLFSNQLSTFDAYMPNLAALDLTNNSFKRFPAAIYKLTKLAVLNLNQNPGLTDLVFTSEQANFLNSLNKFTIDSASLSSNCSSSQQLVLKTSGNKICIILSSGGGGSSKGTDTDGATNNNTGTKQDSSSSKLPLIIGCSAGGLALALVVVLYIRKARRRKGKPTTESAITPNTTAAGGSSINDSRGTSANVISLWNDEDLLSLKVSVDDIEDVKRIGSGAFADVWLVKFRKSELMASKRLRENVQVKRAQTQAFIDEIKLVSALRHPSIVAFKGTAWVRESDLQALFEYMDNGDLRTYLTDSRVPTQWSADKLQFAIDIAEALVYVHSFNPPLVHRDLKSRNVLLNTEMRAKLTDFGVSRYRSEQNTMTVGVGTGRWLAPEVIAGNGSYGTAADMFSFGVLLSELDSHQIPYEDVCNAMGTKLADVALLQLVSTGDLRPSMSRACPDKIAEVANRCFTLDPAQRPNAVEVAYILRTFRKSVTSFYI